MNEMTYRRPTSTAWLIVTLLFLAVPASAQDDGGWTHWGADA